MALQKARRSLASFKMGIAGPSGSGKTVGGILISYGLVKATHPELPEDKLWEKICVIDTENGSGSLYVGETFGTTKVGEYYTIPIEPPYDPEKYKNAILECEKAGVEAVVIDSLSHAWTGEGGLLDQQGKIAARTGNSYTSWRDITPKYCRMWDTILQSKMHMFLTMRSKTEYVIEENEKGKKVPRKVGTAPEMRAGAEYEVTTFLDISLDHVAQASKDRTHRFKDTFFTITEDTGKIIYDWLNANEHKEPEPATPVNMKKAAEIKPEVKPEIEPEIKPVPPVVHVPADNIDDLDDPDYLPFGNDPTPKPVSIEAIHTYLENIVASTPKENRRALGAKFREVTGQATGNYKTYPNEDLRKLYSAMGGK